MRLLMIAAALAAALPALAKEPQTKFAGNRPVSVTDLVDRDGCFPAKLSGRVVKRAFDENGVTLKSVTVEEASGERSFINVDSTRLEAASMAARANAVRALQIVLREGARVRLGVFACGAAGRVMMLDSAFAGR